MLAQSGAQWKRCPFSQVGTGLGPTLEFYTLASKEFQRADLGTLNAFYSHFCPAIGVLPRF